MPIRLREILNVLLLRLVLHPRQGTNIPSFDNLDRAIWRLLQPPEPRDRRPRTWIERAYQELKIPPRFSLYEVQNQVLSDLCDDWRRGKAAQLSYGYVRERVRFVCRKLRRDEGRYLDVDLACDRAGPSDFGTLSAELDEFRETLDERGQAILDRILDMGYRTNIGRIVSELNARRGSFANPAPFTNAEVREVLEGLLKHLHIQEPAADRTNRDRRTTDPAPPIRYDRQELAGDLKAAVALRLELLRLIDAFCAGLRERRIRRQFTWPRPEYFRRALELSDHYLSLARSFFARAADHRTYRRWGTGRVAPPFAARALSKAHPPVAAATQADALRLLDLAIEEVPIADLGRHGFADPAYVLQLISTLRLAVSRREHIAGFYRSIADPNIQSTLREAIGATRPDWSRVAERVVDRAEQGTPFVGLPAVLDLDLDRVKDLLQDMQALWMDHRRPGP